MTQFINVFLERAWTKLLCDWALGNRLLRFVPSGFLGTNIRELDSTTIVTLLINFNTLTMWETIISRKDSCTIKVIEWKLLFIRNFSVPPCPWAKQRHQKVLGNCLILWANFISFHDIYCTYYTIFQNQIHRSRDIRLYVKRRLFKKIKTTNLLLKKAWYLHR